MVSEIDWNDIQQEIANLKSEKLGIVRYDETVHKLVSMCREGKVQLSWVEISKLIKKKWGFYICRAALSENYNKRKRNSFG